MDPIGRSHHRAVATQQSQRKQTEPPKQAETATKQTQAAKTEQTATSTAQAAPQKSAAEQIAGQLQQQLTADLTSKLKAAVQEPGDTTKAQGASIQQPPLSPVQLLQANAQNSNAADDPLQTAQIEAAAAKQPPPAKLAPRPQETSASLQAVTRYQSSQLLLQSQEVPARRVSEKA